MATLQRGTGYHIDVDPLDMTRAPAHARWRPFQGLLALSDQVAGDASLEVVPGWHHTGADWYLLTGLPNVYAVGEFGCATKLDRASDQPIRERFRVATRIPRLWDPTELGKVPTPESPEQVVEWLRCCGSELDGPAERIRAGDYVLWDPRLAHANGSQNTSSVIRRCMYHAYVPAVPAHRPLLSRILRSRRTGEHAEGRSGWVEPGFQASPIPRGALAERLYGLVEWDDAAWPGPSRVTARHVEFLRRYGFVVIEGLLEREEVDELNRATDAWIERQSGVRPADAKTLTFERWEKVGVTFGGMLQVQWLPEMERIRTDPRPYRATVDLCAATWALRAPPFEHPFEGFRSHALWVHPDRQNFRWPDALIRGLDA